MLLTDSLRSHVEQFLKRSYVLQKVTDIQAANVRNTRIAAKLTNPYILFR
jgi:hypothetical protein